MDRSTGDEGGRGRSAGLQPLNQLQIDENRMESKKRRREERKNHFPGSQPQHPDLTAANK
jgi:hypothetical protein